MAAATVVFSSESFITFTTPEETVSVRTRSTVAKHAARYRRSKRSKPTDLQPEKIVQSFLEWRFGPVLALRLLLQASNSQTEIAQYQQAEAEIGHVLDGVPASLEVRPSLQQFLSGNPFFFFPAQIMLDAGTPYANEFFSKLDFKEVYHAAMSMFHSWLSTQFPTQYTVSAALSHQAQAIPILRERLTGGIHDDETYFNILCAMQTDALLGNKQALGAHQRGLEALSRTVNGSLNVYCRSIKPKHDYLVQEPGKPPLFTEKHLHQSTSLHYLSPPYPDHVIKMILSMPSSGFQELAYQDHGLSLDLIAYLSGAIGWADQVNSNSSASSETYDNTPSPLYAALAELWRILGGLDPQFAPLERCICIAHYVQMTSLIYRKIAQSSPIFQALRAEATDIMQKYHPRSCTERENLIFYSLIVVNTWKTGTILEPEGLRLLGTMKYRFPEMRQWDTLVGLLQKFPWVDPVTAEWKENLLQSSSQG